MEKMKKSAVVACAVFGAIGVSGCASTQVADLARRAGAAPAQVEEQRVIRALPSYGNMGGYRYRRFAAVASAG